MIANILLTLIFFSFLFTCIRKDWFGEGFAEIGCIILGSIWLCTLGIHHIKTEEIPYTRQYRIVQFEGKNYFIKEDDFKVMLPIEQEKYEIKQKKGTSFFGAEMTEPPYIKYTK